MTRASFAQRTNWPLGTNALSLLHRRLKAQGVEFIDLTLSNPTQADFLYPQAELLAPLIRTENLVYDPNPRGLLEAREAICAYYASKQVRVQPEQVFITANTSEAYSFVFQLLFNRGDVLLAPQPSYPLLDFLAGLHDVELERYALTQTGKDPWRIDFSNLESKYRKQPKALLLVHPNNPTGNYVSKEEQQKLRDQAKKRAVSFIVDEVFLDYSLEGDKEVNFKSRSFADEAEILTFTLSGISKILGLPQMKLSWIVVSGPVEQKANALARLEIIADTYISASTPIQRALPDWLNKKEAIQNEILERIKKNYAFLQEQLLGSSLKVQSMEGGWQAVIDLPPKENDEDFALALLEKEQVLVHPGYLFDFLSGSCIVVSLLVPFEKFQLALEKLLRQISS